MKILFLVPYPLKESPSQRFRFEQYFSLLVGKGYSFRVQSFLDSNNWRLFSTRGNTPAQIAGLLRGFSKRFFILFRVPFYDFIFIHREAAPLGPPVFEWLIARILRKKIIYDFDDAIWTTDRVHEFWILRMLKWRSKVKIICRWSYCVSCGNDYLVAFASQFNSNVLYNPTTIDTENLHNPELYNNKNNHITIGWTGSHSTLKYLSYLEPVFQQLEKDFPFLKVIIIADKPAPLKSVAFLPWSLQTEVADLCKIDIGIMPLPDDEWSKGKCGFKALQFMALQIPVVASSVGVNVKIIDPGVNGFLASTQSEWLNYLTQLITNDQLQITLGLNGRRKVIKDYSVSSNAQNFLSLFSDQN